MAGYGSGVRTTPTGQDLFSRFAHGVLQGYLSKREQDLQQNFAQSQLAMQQQGATERTQIDAQGRLDVQNSKPSPDQKSQKWVPTTEEDWKRMRDYEESLKAKYRAPKGDGADKGGSDNKNIDSAIKAKVMGWSKDMENSRRGETYTDPYGQVHTTNHLVGAEPTPTYAGGPLPPEYAHETAQVALEMHKTDQEAADIVYAKHTADNAADEYGLNPTEPIFDINKIRSLPSMQGRAFSFSGFGGKSNLYFLTTALIRGGWSPTEIGDVLDEYFGPPTSVNPIQQLMQNPTGASGAAK